MFAGLKKLYFGSLDALDTASNWVFRHTYDLGQPYSLPSNSSRATNLAYRGLEIVAVAILLGILAYYTRHSQFLVMVSSLDAYFLPGLRNVSTTNDSGFFMLQAAQFLEGPDGTPGLFGLEPGKLLPYLLAVVANISGGTLEDSGRILIYLGVFATSFAAYLLLSALNQGLLGALVAVSMLMAGPIYSRTAIGMIDTDVLNLCFVLLIAAAITMATKSKTLWAMLGWAVAAGLTNHLFYLFYANAGFTIGFLMALIGGLIAHRHHPLRSILSVLAFVAFSGLAPTLTAWARIQSFWNVYVAPTPTEQLLEQASTGAETFTSAIFATISEVQPFTVATVSGDFGSLAVFLMGLTGLTLWLLSGWTRLFSILVLLPFIALYMAAGQRFGYYAAPLVFLGLYHLAAQLVKPLVYATKRGLRQETNVQQDGQANTSSARRFRWPAMSLGLLLFSSAWFAEVFYPIGAVPPPVVKANELRPVSKLADTIGPDRVFVASWWDYGFELRYQTRAIGITDGANPADIKNIYLARALISQSPVYAADEIRFAAYFSSEDLQEHYPRRPPISKSRNTDKDIIFFLPSDLQFKMYPVYQIASKTISEEALATYNPETSVFFTLFHKRPERWGEFERVFSQENGAVAYRLIAPTVRGPR